MVKARTRRPHLGSTWARTLRLGFLLAVGGALNPTRERAMARRVPWVEGRGRRHGAGKVEKGAKRESGRRETERGEQRGGRRERREREGRETERERREETQRERQRRERRDGQSE